MGQHGVLHSDRLYLAEMTLDPLVPLAHALSLLKQVFFCGVEQKSIRGLSGTLWSHLPSILREHQNYVPVVVVAHHRRLELADGEPPLFLPCWVSMPLCTIRAHRCRFSMILFRDRSTRGELDSSGSLKQSIQMEALVEVVSRWIRFICVVVIRHHRSC
jgi:hypothetical protein